MHPFVNLLIFAAHKTAAEPTADAGGKGLSLSWAVVLLGLIVGLLVTLSPSKRTTEFKHSKE
jgi:hypothetical protein